MPFSSAELTHIGNTTLDWYMKRGTVFQQAIQKKPLLMYMEDMKETFPGGKDNISEAVKGKYGNAGTHDSLVGYNHDDEVNFYNPANVSRANFPWREHHIGIEVTYSELKKDGISITNEFGDQMSDHTDAELVRLVSIWKDKLQDIGERYAVSANSLLWGDGTGDSKALTGIRGLITANPTTGTIGGINRATSIWWRNLSLTGTNAVVSSPANGGQLVEELKHQWRQLTRYGGTPSKMLAGGDFCRAFERELRANGYYSDDGFTQGKDMKMGDVRFGNEICKYDPTLDDLNLSKRMYWIDCSAIKLHAMEGEWRKNHMPARPDNQFVLHRSITCTGQVIPTQLNSSLVIDIS